MGPHSRLISWVITGGESGSHARPSHPEWFRSLRDQCVAAGVAYFAKQMGSVWAKEHKAKQPHGNDINEWPEDLRIREYPHAL